MPPTATTQERDSKRVSLVYLSDGFPSDRPGMVVPVPCGTWSTGIPRKEVIQPHLPVRLPCYDFTPVTWPTFDGCLQLVSPPASGVPRFRGVTGGVYKTREHIHRCVLTSGY
jgi:hypothetical protein